jgi:hypothetical protein
MSTVSKHGNKSAVEYVQRHYDLLNKLPREGGLTLKAFPMDEDTADSVSRKGRNAGIIEGYDTVRVPGERERTVYRLTELGREILADTDGPQYGIQMPCGHTGMTNLEDSEYYQCTTCQGRFTRDEIEQ